MANDCALRVGHVVRWLRYPINQFHEAIYRARLEFAARCAWPDFFGVVGGGDGRLSAALAALRPLRPEEDDCLQHAELRADNAGSRAGAQCPQSCDTALTDWPRSGCSYTKRSGADRRIQ